MKFIYFWMGFPTTIKSKFPSRIVTIQHSLHIREHFFGWWCILGSKLHHLCTKEWWAKLSRTTWMISWSSFWMTSWSLVIWIPIFPNYRDVLRNVESMRQPSTWENCAFMVFLGMILGFTVVNGVFYYLKFRVFLF